ncbi:DoxX family protein [Sphingobacterium sp. SRCM116780]|uniref:DoxX family protein n=1 Tax=Sphingobacterium sp. SRCM116780 TaxID=2907623 RepID=UPI001F3A3AD7|nr:DoxX family protein [Sphingobacterium sp. SRCM116780]UIR54575.1 DoxX family protein [Sphingobacterium sp. SRCM116780]
MNLIHKIEHWGDSHHPQWIDYLRIALGILILVKGMSFVGDLDGVGALVQQVNYKLYIWGGVHYIVFAQIVGGLFLIFGFQTRLAAAVLLPILFGAVFFVNITNGFSFLNSELWLSIIVFIFLIVFLIMGSGKYSLDNLMDKPGYSRKI